MTVEALRTYLKQFPQDMPVFLSVDEEGNGFNPLYEGEEYWMDLSVREIYDSPFEHESLTKVLVLWP
ncbi:MAG: hypothetical protein ACHQ1D_01335 [Nitrososphaerales archaeon]